MNIKQMTKIVSKKRSSNLVLTDLYKEWPHQDTSLLFWREENDIIPTEGIQTRRVPSLCHSPWPKCPLHQFGRIQSCLIWRSARMVRTPSCPWFLAPHTPRQPWARTCRRWPCWSGHHALSLCYSLMTNQWRWYRASWKQESKLPTKKNIFQTYSWHCV